ncbi:uncharacterized protein LOC115624501 [Scaptodrosophila lebanonensis]|uniref:Uncharacterized protein LOC115624501 n=1 Tax=Drosophila lebanonensis TaxID=7225 RepID=A0A6J2THY4_DROLE|nr:uncharacterized protein LOC115624501 [Scaptodrosophila lebanonensis]
MPIVAYHNEMNDKHDHVYCDKTSVYPPPPVVQVPGTNYSMSRFIVDSDNAKFVILWSCMDFKTQHTGTVETFAKSKLTAAEIEKVKAIHKQNGFKHTVFFCP